MVYIAKHTVLFLLLAATLVLSALAQEDVESAAAPGDGEADGRTFGLIKKHLTHKRYTGYPPYLGGGGLLGGLLGGLGGLGGFGGGYYGGNPYYSSYGHGYGYGGSPFIGGRPANPGGIYGPGAYPPGYGGYHTYPGGYGGGYF